MPGGDFVDACMFCAYTLGLQCGGLGAVAPRGRGEAQAASRLEPDEALLESITSRRTRRSSRPRGSTSRSRRRR